MIATPSRRTTLAPSAFGGGGGGRGGGSGSSVGEAGKGAAVLSQPQAQRGGGGGRANAAPQGRGPAPVAFGGVDPVFAVGSDGLIHTLLSSNGADAEPPVAFLPPSTKPSSLLWVDGVIYAATTGDCGAAPNAVWAMDLTAPAKERKTLSWKTDGADIAGTDGVALGTDGTVYVALAKPDASLNSSSSSGKLAATGSAGAGDSVVALDPATLQPKDWFSAPGADFASTPLVIRHKDKDLLAAVGNDGKLYLLDGASLGGSDHKTPLFVSAKFTASGGGTGLATWDDKGTRWILATATGTPPAEAAFTANGVATHGRVVAFQLTDSNGKLSLEPGWASRDLIAPLAPIVINDMVFAVSSGEYRPPSGGATVSATQRAQRSVPAVLYVLDGATGKTLWTSGTTITSFARGGLAASSGQVYLVTFDNQLYAFGIPMEH